MRAPPVLCYHRIGGPLELGVTRIARSVFERQMRTLADAGWRSLTLTEFAARLAHPPSRIPHPEVLLTFDDGYASLAAHAYPVLADLGFTATTFLVTDFVGCTNRWDMRYTWRRLAHLDWPTVTHWRGRGFAFGSHGATHRRLTWLGDGELEAELARSRAALRGRLGDEAGDAIAYPFGAADDRVRRLAQEVGYRLGFGGVQGGAGDALDLARVPVYVWDRWSPPAGLRNDGLGRLGRAVAHAANRCAVGTSLMLALMGRGGRRGAGDPPAPAA